LDGHQSGLQNAGLTITGIAGGGVFAILLSAQPTWPWHVLVLLFGSAALAALLFGGAAVGAGQAIRQATNNEIMTAVNALGAKVDTLGRLTYSGPAYASASVAAIAAGGPPPDDRNVTVVTLGGSVFAHEDYDDLSRKYGWHSA
jgi:hypothetical protein